MASLVPPDGWAYGLQLPIQTLTRSQVDPWEDAATVGDLVAVAQKAEATGHAFVGVCDHIAIPGDAGAAQMSTTWYDPIATLGFLAAHTRSVRLLSEVWIAAHRHPLQTASAFGTLDHLSGDGSSSGSAPGTSRASSPRSAPRSMSAAPSSTRRSRRCGASSATASYRSTASAIATGPSASGRSRPAVR